MWTVSWAKQKFQDQRFSCWASLPCWSHRTGVLLVFDPYPSKYEEVLSPVIDDFVYITDGTYSRDEVFRILPCVYLSIDYPNRSYHTWCSWVSSEFDDGAKFSRSISTGWRCHSRISWGASRTCTFCWTSVMSYDQYLAELSLPLYSLTRFYPSQIAASCACLSLHTFRRPVRRPYFIFIFTCSLHPCSNLLGTKTKLLLLRYVRSMPPMLKFRWFLKMIKSIRPEKSTGRRNIVRLDPR